jgi:hypothetical protein
MMAHPAIAFLRILDPNPSARFGIETYTDVPRGGTSPSQTARVGSLTVSLSMRLKPCFHN